MRAFSLLLVLASAPAFSCPDLEGFYGNCRSSDPLSTSISEMSVAQKVIKKQHQFILTTKELAPDNTRTEKYLADGKAKRTSEVDPDTGVSITSATTTSCEEDALIIRTEALIDSEEFANLTLRITKSGKQLVQTLSGLSMGIPVNETLYCE